MDCEKSINPSSSVIRSIAAGIVMFLFAHLMEVSLSYLLHTYKLLSANILYYSLTYLIFGVLFGLVLGIIVSFIAILERNRKGTGQGLSPTFLGVSAFIWLYAVVVFNAYYLPESSVLSAGNLFVTALLTALCIFLFMMFSKLFGSADRQVLSGRAVSIFFSAAAVLVALHSSMTPRFDTDRPGLAIAGTIACIYVLAAFSVVFLENGLMRLMTRRKSFGTAQRIWFGSGLAKFFAVLTLLALVFFVRYRPPIRAVYEANLPPPKRAPNIILIVLDTLRQDRLSAYGCERDTSPHIANMAEESLVFDALAPSNWSLPSHASLLTGLYPTENGTGTQMSLTLDEKNETLAEILVNRGYTTGAIVANYGWLGMDSGFPQGFNYYFADTGETLPPFPFVAGYFLKKFLPDSRVFDFTPYMRASVVSDKAIKWIDANHDRNFFLFLNYMDAHEPYSPPSPYDTKWFEGGSRLNFFDPPTIFEDYRNNVNAGLRSVTDEEREFLLSQYDGEISYLDEHVGRLLSHLKQLGVYEKSLIIITADHGEFFGEHNFAQHFAFPYQEVIQVPLIVKLPGGEERSTIVPSAPVSLVNLFHSILNYLGVTEHFGKKGVDLFSGETAAIVVETHAERKKPNGDTFEEHHYALIENRLKLIISSNGELEEGYDIHKDSVESNNLLQEPPAESTSRAFARIRSSLDRKIGELNANALEPAELDAETHSKIEEKLKALGYIQ